MPLDWPFQPGAKVVTNRTAGRFATAKVLTVARCAQSEGTGSSWRVYFERDEGIEDDTWFYAHALTPWKEPPPPPPAPMTEEDLLAQMANERFGIF